MKLIVKFKDDAQIYKIERIDFFQKSFSVFVEEKMGFFRAKKNVDVEYIKHANGDLIYPNENHINSFASAIMSAFLSGGGTEEDALEYFTKTYQ